MTGLDKMTSLGNVGLRVNRTVGDHSYNYWRLYQLLQTVMPGYDDPPRARAGDCPEYSEIMQHNLYKYSVNNKHYEYL